MPRQNPTDKLATLQQKMSQLKAQADALQAQQRDKDRKDDTRRKILAGALALEHADKNAGSEFAKVMHKLLNEYVKRPADRALFPTLSGDGDGGTTLKEAAREIGRTAGAGEA